MKNDIPTDTYEMDNLFIFKLNMTFFMSCYVIYDFLT